MPATRSTTVRLAALAVVLIIAGVLAGCRRPAVEPVAEDEPIFDPLAETEVIMALEREWSARLAAGDVDWIVDLHTADAWQLPPGGEPIVGREALRAVWEEVVATEGLEISWQPTLARVSAAGDLAYDLGRATIRNPDGSEVPAKYLVVWVREGGRWKVAADMFSANVGH